MLEVIGGPSGFGAKDNFFGSPATHQASNLFGKVFLGKQELIFLRQRDGVTAGATPRNNRDFPHDPRVRQHQPDNRVPSFVVSHHAALALGNDPVLLGWPSNDAVFRFINITGINLGFTSPRRDQSRFVQDVFQIGPHKAWGFARQLA